MHVAQEMVETRPQRAVALAIEILAMTPPPSIAAAAAALLKDMVPGWHFVIVRDDARNSAYDRALRRAVTPQSRVLDIGSGTGLLAMMAARAGAGEVFTCEQNAAVAAAARRVLEANGFADRIRLIGKHSSELDLDRDLGGPVDVLVSEIVSNNLIGEGCLPVMEEAARWLKPDGQMIPRAGTVRVALVWSDTAEREAMGMVEGFDLSAFNMLAAAARRYRVGDPKIDIRSSSADLMHFDFRSGGPFRAHEARAAVVADGRPANGVIQWIRLNIDDSILYENRPAPGTESCWAALFYPLPEILERRAGETVHILGTHDRVSLFIRVAAAGETGA
ncbi:MULTISPECIES: methyltransferase domain-containing protein [unclassified Sphingomonas]|nr:MULTISPECIES: methyltransferase domain-containing protein [unclassified Sphingomonas]